MTDELIKRQGQAVARILDFNMCAGFCYPSLFVVNDDEGNRLPESEWHHEVFDPNVFGLPSAQQTSLTFDGVFRDQCETWPTHFPGWIPLSLEEFRAAWNGVGMMLVGN